MTEQIVFYLFSFLIIASAMAVVTLKNIFHCALFLILCLFCVAGIYVMLHAEFLAVVQVLLYVGAVAILIIFAIMLTSKLAGREIQMTNEQTFIGAFLSILLAFGLIYALSGTVFRLSTDVPGTKSSFEIGRLFMTDYVLPFELVSVLLLAALIGAIIIARQEGN
jgi:NADH-quinone oxidoreductase subunit J